MKLEIEPVALQQSFDIAGNDRSWRDRIRQFCRRHRINPGSLIEATVRIFNPGASKNQFKKERHRIKVGFENRRSPTVCEQLRRVVAYLTVLVGRGQPLPIAAA